MRRGATCNGIAPDVLIIRMTPVNCPAISAGTAGISRHNPCL
jgi:hypothetical protein